MRNRISVAAFFLILCHLSCLPSVKGYCTSQQFTCDNTRCIPQSWKCDEYDDCGDNSDENGCPVHNCTEQEFTCNNKKCIPKLWLCDNEDDCNDRSDENPEYCANKTCGPDTFVCQNSPNFCIPNSWLCDTYDDCSDASDERDHCVKLNCTREEFSCANGRCITNRWVCDQENDCMDNSDEKDCPGKTCQIGEFQCKNGRCIPGRWHCDGGADCMDHSDEENCPEDFVHHLDSDCTSREFTCADGVTCIHTKWVCDGDPDCPDDSDEVNCTTTCRPDQFQCKNHHCIPMQLKCNGQDECRDNSDEEDCDSADSSIKTCDLDTEFDCGRNMCIPLTKACDRVNDCGEWEDEPSDLCNVDECEVNNGGCAQICQELPIGYRCSCKPGFRAVGNSSCEDIDECQKLGVCSQTCINTKGGYKCECLPGYRSEPSNRHRCRALGEKPFLIFAHREDIRQIDLDSRDYITLFDNLKSAISLDYIHRTRTLVWLDTTEEQIMSAELRPNATITKIYSANIKALDRLAVDWIHNHIYWADTDKKTIEVVDLSGENRKTLIDTMLDEPRGIALNPMEGWMFWSDWGDVAKIEKSGMDGSLRQTIIEDNVLWPNGLTLDFTTKRIFWADAKLHLLASADYDGSNVHTLQMSPSALSHPYSLDVFEDWVYWTDWVNKAIMRANKFTGKELKKLVQGVPSVMDVRVFHQYKQPAGINYCAQLTTPCSHLCLRSPNITEKVVCICPDGLFLDVDQRTCIKGWTTTTSALETTTVQESTTPAIELTTTGLTSSASTISGLPTTSSFSTFSPPTTGSSTTDDSISLDNEIITNAEVMAADDGGGLSAVALITICVVGTLSLFLVLALLCYITYRHYIRRHISSMNFDNPVYRKTTEDQFSLEKNQFEPPRSYPPSLEPLTTPGTNEFV